MDLKKSEFALQTHIAIECGLILNFSNKQIVYMISQIKFNVFIATPFN